MKTIVVTGYKDSSNLYRHLFRDPDDVFYFQWRDLITVQYEFDTFMQEHEQSEPYRIISHSLGALISLLYLCTKNNNHCISNIIINPLLDPCIYQLYRPIRTCSEFLLKHFFPRSFPLKIMRKKDLTTDSPTLATLYHDPWFEYAKKKQLFTSRNYFCILHLHKQLKQNIHTIVSGVVKVYQSTNDDMVNQKANLIVLKPIFYKIEYRLIPGSHRVFNERHIWDQIKDQVPI